MIKPAPLKGKKHRRSRSNKVGWKYLFYYPDVAALKLWLESKDLKGTFGFVMISKKDWKEGWSDVNK